MNDRNKKMIYIEARSKCQALGNDKERIQKHIEWLEEQVKAFKKIIETEDFRK